MAADITEKSRIFLNPIGEDADRKKSDDAFGHSFYCDRGSVLAGKKSDLTDEGRGIVHFNHKDVAVFKLVHYTKRSRSENPDLSQCRISFLMLLLIMQCFFLLKYGFSIEKLILKKQFKLVEIYI
jgi:hypothetical protein